MVENPEKRVIKKEVMGREKTSEIERCLLPTSPFGLSMVPSPPPHGTGQLKGWIGKWQNLAGFTGRSLRCRHVVLFVQVIRQEDSRPRTISILESFLLGRFWCSFGAHTHPVPTAPR